MNTQKLEQVPIDKLVPYDRNARTHSKEQIAQLRASLRDSGFVSPAVIDADYNHPRRPRSALRLPARKDMKPCPASLPRT